jgi:hypothetical protein
MDGTTGQGQFSVDLRQHPRLRVSAPFVCSFSRLGLAKWLGRGGGRHRGRVRCVDARGQSDE